MYFQGLMRLVSSFMKSLTFASMKRKGDSVFRALLSAVESFSFYQEVLGRI